ncbi:hypothetical protein [Chryseobacterium potabilaquae]|uniref:C1q domain-containing protein n=1 Tax=Chryseobacterium potabilaquae TaxID=2675057 RepID=A0A6N4X7I7_9FLAO|nr:hypothetical protein [Chryseobacterium potabilaquae]CAA7197051.1 hypothetical protein CHRY9293_03108 [Chryseobacterium potabilaquae]
MKKNAYTAMFCIVFSSVYSQVGVNTQTPKSTLDVTAKGSAQDYDGLQAPRLTRTDLTNKGDTLYGEDQKGVLIYITDIAGGNALGPRINVDTVGYYYFDGSMWKKLAANSTGAVIGYSALVSGNQVSWPGNNIFQSIDFSVGSGSIAAWRTNSSTLTVPAGNSGLYIINYTLGLLVNGGVLSSYIFAGSLLINGIVISNSGTTVGGGSGFSYNNNFFSLSWSEIINLNDGDTIQLNGITYGTSGVPLGFKLARLSLEKIN